MHLTYLTMKVIKNDEDDKIYRQMKTMMTMMVIMTMMVMMTVMVIMTMMVIVTMIVMMTTMVMTRHPPCCLAKHLLQHYCHNCSLVFNNQTLSNLDKPCH